MRSSVEPQGPPATAGNSEKPATFRLRAMTDRVRICWETTGEIVMSFSHFYSLARHHWLQQKRWVRKLRNWSRPFFPAARYFIRAGTKSVSPHHVRAGELPLLSFRVVTCEATNHRLPGFFESFARLFPGADCVQAMGGSAQLRGPNNATEGHIRAISSVTEADLLFIFEDDFRFIDSLDPTELGTYLSCFAQDPSLDVFMLCGEALDHPVRVNKKFYTSTRICGLAGYVVKSHSAPLLLQSFRESLQLPKNLITFEGWPDVHWWNLQKQSLVFAIPDRPIGMQSGGFSTTEAKDRPERHLWKVGGRGIWDSGLS